MELGHIKDQEELLNFQSSKNAIYYNFKSSMSEVISSFYEVKFLSFLLDSKYIKKKYHFAGYHDYFILNQLGLLRILSSLDEDILKHEKIIKRVDNETFYNILIG